MTETREQRQQWVRNNANFGPLGEYDILAIADLLNEWDLRDAGLAAGASGQADERKALVTLLMMADLFYTQEGLCRRCGNKRVEHASSCWIGFAEQVAKQRASQAAEPSTPRSRCCDAEVISGICQNCKMKCFTEPSTPPILTSEEAIAGAVKIDADLKALFPKPSMPPSPEKP